MFYARISGVGVYLPKRVVTNEELSGIMNYDVEGYLKDKGISLRHVASPDESTSDMAAEAAKRALMDAGLSPEDVDLIILSTDTPDYITPPTSPIIQFKIGAKRAGAFDINAACADETIALSIASHYIMMDDSINNVLVIGAYSMTRWLDWRDYEHSTSKVLAMLFGDGAGALVISRSDEPGFITSKIAAEGEFWDTYGVYLGSARMPTVEMIEKRLHFLRFHENKHRVPKDFNYTRWPRIIRETVEKAGAKVDELSLILFNQVSLEDIRLTMEELGLSMERTHTVMDKYGYTGSASTIMALYDALEEGKVRKGDYVMFCTSGAGFVVATALFRW